MKKWVCTVCGYIHEGEEPPDTCPVCGADKSMFEEVTGDAPAAAPQSRPAPKAAAPAASASAGATWECTVCGTTDGGDKPPAECPVCGADQSLFKPGDAAASTAAGKSQPSPTATKPKPAARTGRKGIDLGPEPASFAGRIHYRVVDQMLRHHIHPMSVHVPNGVIPFCFIFILLAAVSGCRALAIAAQCNMIFVVLAMPLVLYSGYIEWQRRYKGFPSNRFITKIVCAAIVTVSAAAVVVWWWIDPAVVQHAPVGFLLVNFIMLVAAGIAGLIGGKLVFKD